MDLIPGDTGRERYRGDDNKRHVRVQTLEAMDLNPNTGKIYENIWGLSCEFYQGKLWNPYAASYNTLSIFLTPLYDRRTIMPKSTAKYLVPI